MSHLPMIIRGALRGGGAILKSLTYMGGTPSVIFSGIMGGYVAFGDDKQGGGGI